MEKMEEMQAAELARHRVDQGAGGYYAKIMDKDQIIVITISGRGDKDCAAIARYRGEDLHE